MSREPVRAVTVGVMAAAALLFTSACGSEADDFIEDTYKRTSTRGDTETYHSKISVGGTARDIAAANRPIARQADGGSEYLRYDDDIVIVSAASGGGSTVRVEDIDGRYRSGAYIFLGSRFNPHSPAGAAAGSGGSGEAK